MANYEALKEKIFEAVGKYHPEMIECNDDLADHPEVSAHEYRSSQKLVELLRGHGYEVEYPFAGIDTCGLIKCALCGPHTKAQIRI